jgi:predicted DNA-binding antitoxin AbrB/MazE fold protein
VDTIVTAVYERGVLRLLQPLSLPEHTCVRIQVLETEEGEEMNEVRRVEAVLIAAGMIEPLSSPRDLPEISEKRLAEVADRYAVGGPLSEVIIAERDGDDSDLRIAHR